jgi:hypothetical protein
VPRRHQHQLFAECDGRGEVGMFDGPRDEGAIEAALEHAGDEEFASSQASYPPPTAMMGLVVEELPSLLAVTWHSTMPTAIVR